MGFLSDLNFGGSTSAFGSSTSSFDFGSLANSAVSAGAQGSDGFNTGAAANMALEGAASLIPGGALVKDVLDQLGLQDRIDAVSKYGIGSWGAMTPEKRKQEFHNNVYPWVQKTLQSVNNSNLEQVLNELSVKLTFNMHLYDKLYQNHSNAKSSKIANSWARDEFKKLLNDYPAEIVRQFKNQGVTINVNTIQASPIDYNVIDLGDMDGRILEHDMLKLPVSLKTYSVDFSTVSSSTIKIGEDGKPIVKANSSGSGLLMLGGGILLAVKKGLLKI
ncbi:hypothetical protein [Christiangramia sp. SM2212]|uniref:Uncharacterized protein n=1 Tax=Christiangramia sediminicola TaxID=3073267 RepID=A0ABU1EQG0_9FLAO|nr:hypothetical protein [Christiangramia sp. SM2212]MDR5590252.1 hypothetical protein [Christiangramia sp. SM2212]